MRKALLGFLVVLMWAAPCRAAGLELSLQDGKVTLDAQGVTIREILTEWARVGKTKIVNIERLSGAPVTIKFEGVPEKQALEIVLRSVPGYVAAPRTTWVADESVYETILIMATTSAAPTARPSAAAIGNTSPNANLVGPGRVV